MRSNRCFIIFEIILRQCKCYRLHIHLMGIWPWLEGLIFMCMSLWAFGFMLSNTFWKWIIDWFIVNLEYELHQYERRVCFVLMLKVFNKKPRQFCQLYQSESDCNCKCQENCLQSSLTTTSNILVSIINYVKNFYFYSK